MTLRILSTADVPNLIPVLVPAKAGEPDDGSANFLKKTKQKNDAVHSWETDNRRIRCVADDDLRRAKQVLSRDKQQLLSGALDLRIGYETKDSCLLEQGFNKIGEGWLASAFASRDVRALRRWARLRYSLIVTEQLTSARLVMWFWPEKEVFTPAFFVPTIDTGVFLKSLLAIRSCPYCGELFLPERNNIIYCCLPHREAYRTARSRWYKKNGALRNAHSLEGRQ